MLTKSYLLATLTALASLTMGAPVPDDADPDWIIDPRCPQGQWCCKEPPTTDNMNVTLSGLVVPCWYRQAQGWCDRGALEGTGSKPYCCPENHDVGVDFGSCTSLSEPAVGTSDWSLEEWVA